MIVDVLTVVSAAIWAVTLGGWLIWWAVEAWRSPRYRPAVPPGPADAHYTTPTDGPDPDPADTLLAEITDYLKEQTR